MISILYVDDEAGLLEISKIFLEKDSEFAVNTTISAQEALASPVISSYDAIVSDYQMPGMDGIAFLKEVRQRHGDIPFILFTGRGREEVVIDAINNGVDFYVQKGGDPKSQFAELKHKIRKAVTRRQADILRSESEKRLFDIINFLPDATFAIDYAGTVIAWNRAMEEMSGIPAAEMLGKGDYEYAIPFYGSRRKMLIDRISEHDEIIARNYAHISRNKETLIADTTHPHPKGRTTILMGMASPLYNRDGKIVGTIESIRDISDRVLAEEGFRQSESRLRSFIETTHESVVLTDEEGTVIEWNAGSERISGIRKEDALGLPLWDLTFRMLPVEHRTPERQNVIEQKIRASLITGVPPFSGAQVIESERPDGSRIFTLQVLFPIKTAKGFRFGSVIHDITDKKLAEEALRESEEKFRSIVETSPDIIWEIDLHGNFRYMSPTVKTLLGYTPEEVIGRSIADLAAEAGKPVAMRELMQALSSKDAIQPFEIPARHRDGQELILEIRSARLTDPRGIRTGFRGVAVDITKRKMAEKALSHANRQLQLLGSTTRHDILNKISVIRGFLQVTKMKFPDPKLHEILQKIDANMKVIQSLMEFTRVYQNLGTRQPQWIELDTVMPRAQVPGTISLIAEIKGISLFADPMLEKIFYNLLDNSIRHGEKVTEIKIFSRNEDGNLVVVWEDNGVGVPAGDKERIFEQGFGKHTGFGLFLIREILLLTDITIRETGEPGKGARFEILVKKGQYRVVPAT